MEFIHSVLSQDVPRAVTNISTLDLPVNPLSHVLITLKYNRTGAAAAALPLIANTLGLMSRIEILYKGSAIFSMSGYDAVACGLYVADFESWGINYGGIATEECSFTWCIPLGRILYDPRECFPRSTRGELVLQITYAAAFTDITAVLEQIETIELPDASPSQYLRMTTLSATLTVGIENDIPLPIGNPISDIVLYGAEIPQTTAALATLGYLQILIDNQRRFYSHTNYETHHNMAGRMRPAPGYWGSHKHYTVTTTISNQNMADDHILACYSHLPFDIFKNGEYALQTAGRSSVNLRIGVDVGVTGLGVRVIPCEICPAGAGA